MRRLALLASLFALTALAACRLSTAQAVAAPAAGMRTERVAMRDGTRLATDIYLPAGGGRHPAILLRTPYNKDGGASLGADGARRGYAIVVQDTRGRFASEGLNLPFESDGWWDGRWDGYDTLEWISRQPWCDSHIGTSGGSALGVAQLLAAGTGTRRIAAQVVHVGAGSFYPDVVYPGGVFKRALAEDWLRATRYAPDALSRWTAHPTYDSYWRTRDLALRYAKVDAPAVHVGGWYDIFARGTIEAFQGYQTHGGPRARGHQKLVMGPWTHGIFQSTAGELQFPIGNRPPGKVADPWAWFDRYLKGVQNGVDREPAVTYYVMGDTTDPSAPGNQWRTADRWPPVPTRETPLYLRSNRSLSLAAPDSSDAALTYVYDPADPTPGVGGTHLTIPAGPMEQSRVEGRRDLLVFTGEPLPAPIEVTGTPRADIWFSSDAPDTDLFVTLCDVHPNGRSYNICDGRLRLRFREGFERGRPMAPGRVYRVRFDLWPTSIVFNRGHRIRVQIASCNAPGYDPNPNTGAPFRSGPERRPARNSVRADAAHASRLLLPVAVP
ncbi:MAG: CocE/NonD family hydrolase [Chthonomonadales bacterium]|nr:CocE/NonD family hydrolase [Chthonomonadales bacterium]